MRRGKGVHWEDTNGKGGSEGGGRCGTFAGIRLCSNAYSPAEKEKTWFARRGRRYGSAFALRLCGYADTAEQNHATVGQGGWRGGRCGTRCCTRLCGSAHLARRRGEKANGGTRRRRRCRSFALLSLCANVDAGVTREAAEGRTEEWGRGGERCTGMNGRRGGTWGTRGGAGESENTLSAQENKATTRKHIQSRVTELHAHGSCTLPVEIVTCHTHTVGRRPYSDILVDMDSATSNDGNGGPAEERHKQSAREPEGGSHRRSREEKQAARGDLARYERRKKKEHFRFAAVLKFVGIAIHLTTMATGTELGGGPPKWRKIPGTA